MVLSCCLLVILFIWCEDLAYSKINSPSWQRGTLKPPDANRPVDKDHDMSCKDNDVDSYVARYRGCMEWCNILVLELKHR